MLPHYMAGLAPSWGGYDGEACHSIPGMGVWQSPSTSIETALDISPSRQAAAHLLPLRQPTQASTPGFRLPMQRCVVFFFL